MTSTELAALCQSVRQRDPDAETELIALLGVRLGKYLALWFKDQADDFFQRIAVIVVENLRAGRVEHPERVVFYALDVARHLRYRDLRERLTQNKVVSIDDARQARRLQKVIAVPAMQEAEVLASETEERQARQFLRALKTLDPMDQEIVRGSYFDKQSTQELRQRLGLTERQFVNRKSKALTTIRKAVERYKRLPDRGGELAAA